MSVKTIDWELNKKIGAKLHQVRLRSGQSQFTVACDLNYSTTSYSKHENGKVDFTVTKLNQLARHFDVYLPDFLDDTVPVPRLLREMRSPEDYKSLEAKYELLRELVDSRLVQK